MKIQVKKIDPTSSIPTVALEGDAGLDLRANEDVILKPGERKSIKTGLAIKIPTGYAGLIWDKSGIAHKKGLKTLGGVIDANFTGEWQVGLVNLSREDYQIKKGDKIAQVLFQKVEIPQIEIVAELETTIRGEKGFGSTGLK